MKKIISLFIGVLLVVSLLSANVFAAEANAAVISADSFEVKAGATVTVEFKISNNPGFDSTKMNVEVAEPLALTGYATGLLDSAPNDKNFPSKFIISHAATATTENGTLFSLTVKVADNAAPGKYPVTLTVERLRVKDGDQSVDVACNKTVKAYITVVGEPHTHDFKFVETVAPTCLEKGYDVYKCDCGETENRNYIDALGHEYKPVETVESTCAEAGYVIHKCVRCDVSEKEELPLADHKFGTAYEFDTKEHWHICEVCGAEDNHEAHDMKEVGKTEVQVENGIKTIVTLKCNKCAYTTERDDVALTGDITEMVTFGAIAMISMAAAAAYVVSRKVAKK